MRMLACGLLVATLSAASACDDPMVPDESPDAGETLPDSAVPPPVVPDAAVDADTPLDAAASPDALPPVPPSGTWFVESAPVPDGIESAVIADGELVLTVEGDHASSCAGALFRCFPTMVFQRGLDGDFDVTLDVASFTGATNAGVFLFAEVEGQLTHYDIGSTEPTTLRMRRANDHLVVSSQKAGQAEIVGIEVDVDRVFRIGIGLAQGASAAAATAHLSAFRVEGGGGNVKADAFDEAATLDP
jgi:hypothetical protein